MSIAQGIRTYRGSCHCGAVRYEADFDLSAGTGRCNCSICWKSGWWGIIVKPEQFRLLSGEDALLTFPRIPQSDRPQCRICGVASFNRGNVPEIGGAFISLNVRCLDGVELAGVPVRYMDGLHDTWATLAVEPWADPFKGAGFGTIRTA